MLVLRELSDLTPVAGFYQPLRGESIRPRGIYVKGTPVGASVYANDARDPAALHAELEGAAQRAVKLAHRLHAGELLPCPQTCSRDGSGKTAVLVERFVAAVREDGIAVAAIRTITFTEKAAAELRDRIRSRLRELGEAEAARATEGAFISTIHGFCARVLRAHALAAGIDPHFTVLDRGDSEPLAYLAFDDALDELAKSSEQAVDLIAAYGPAPLRWAILGTYAQLRSGGQSAPRLPACPQPPGRGAAARTLEQAADAA